MNMGRTIIASIVSFSLAACGGGDESPPPAPTAGSGGSTTTTASTGCSLAAQQAFADDVLDEWYLFPDLLDNTVNPDDFTDLQSYLDARVAPARAQNRDNGFTFATSIAEENALINSGSSAGFGFRLVSDTVNRRIFVTEAFESGSGFAAGIDRGTELLAIGTTANNLQTVSALFAAGGAQAVINALGPSDPGVTRVIRFAQPDGTVLEQTISKTNFALDPISDRYGALVLNVDGRQVAYFNLRTFIIGTSDRELVESFQTFADQGITEFVIDFRYNGGGLVRIAELMGDLLRANNTGQVFSSTVLRESQSDRNETRLFANTARFFNAQSGDFGPETSIPSVNPIKIAFIGRQSTASASELVVNSMLPYVAPANLALVGTNTSGKPVGQFAFDLDDCDLRIRAVTFQTLNANNEGEYFTGLASVVPNTCSANDGIFTPLGDPAEASLAAALDFLNGDTCTPFAGTAGSLTAQSVGGRVALQPSRPNAAQREMPGLF